MARRDDQGPTGVQPDPGERGEAFLARLMVAWVDRVRTHSRPILFLTILSTLALAVYTVFNLGINTQPRALLSPGLGFWKDYTEFEEVFPILEDALLIVVDGETPLRARDATAMLAARLRENKALFSDVYVPGGGEFFEREALLYLTPRELQDLSDDLASVQPILAEIARDPSLTNLAHVLSDGIAHLRTEPDMPVDLSKVFDSLSVAVQAVLDGRPRPVSWTELILDRKLPGESSQRLIVAEPIFDFSRLLPGREAMQAVRSAAVDLGLTESQGIRVRITGNVALNTEEMVLVAEQVGAMGIVSFVMIAGILWVALRSLRLVLAILLTLLVGLIWTAAFAAATVGHVNVVSVAFAILFIGLGVDFGIHVTMRYAELVRGGEDHARALSHTTASVGTSLVLCVLTTSIGFYVFVPTEYRGVAEMGLIAGTGMPISLFWTFTLLPILLGVGDRTRVGREWPVARRITGRLIHLAITHPRRVGIVAGVLGLAGLCVLPLVRFDQNVVALRDPSTESVQTFNELLAQSDTSPWTIEVMAPSLDAAVALSKKLRKLDVVERAVTLADYVPKDQEEKMEILADMALFLPPVNENAVPARPPLAEQIAALRALRDALQSPWLDEGDARRRASAERARDRLTRFLTRLQTIEAKQEELASFEQSVTGELSEEMQRLWRALDPAPITLDSLPRDLVARMVAPDGRARVEVLPSEDLSDNEAHARFVNRVREVAPHATGLAVSIYEWGRAVVRTFQQALASAVVAIALLLIALWRRFSDMVLVLAPLLLASVMTAATATLLGISFNFVNVVVIPLLLGIGVDSGIHLVHRYRIAHARHPDLPITDSDLLSTSTAPAVLFSAITTMGSFGSLALVTHPGMRSLGELLLIGVTYMLLANLVVLPALIALRRATPLGDKPRDAEAAAGSR